MKIQEKNSIRDGGSTTQKMLTLLHSLLTLTLCMNTLFYFGCFENRNRLLRISIVLLCFHFFSFSSGQSRRRRSFCSVETFWKIFVHWHDRKQSICKTWNKGSTFHLRGDKKCQRRFPPMLLLMHHIEVWSFSHNISSFSNEHFYESVFETLALGDLGFPCLGQSWEIES